MKKLLVSSDLVGKAIKKLSLAVNNRSILPALRNIYCRVTKGEVEMITSDQEITISYKVPAETYGYPFEMLLPFDYLKDLTPLLQGAPMEIELTGARKAKIKSNEDVDELNSLDKLDEYPDVPAVPKKNVLSLDADFVPTLARVMNACALEKNHAILSKACLDIREADVNLVAMDMEIFYQQKLKLETTITDQILFTEKIANAISGMGAMELSWSQKQMAFKSDTVTVWAQRHEDKYPDYKVIIPKNEWNLQLESEPFRLALKKACLTKNPTKRTMIELKSRPGTIHFEAEDLELARKTTANVSGQYTGTTEKIAIHAGKFLTLMDQLEAQSVRLHIHNPEKAIMITSEDDSDFLGLILPFKLN